MAATKHWIQTDGNTGSFQFRDRDEFPAYDGFVKFDGCVHLYKYWNGRAPSVREHSDEELMAAFAIGGARAVYQLGARGCTISPGDPAWDDDDNVDYMHVCDIDEMIERLTELREMARVHFGEHWPR